MRKQNASAKPTVIVAFSISPAYLCGQKTFDALSEWNRRFKISQGQS